jgi:hypothetical protein
VVPRCGDRGLLVCLVRGLRYGRRIETQLPAEKVANRTYEHRLYELSHLAVEVEAAGGELTLTRLDINGKYPVNQLVTGHGSTAA